MTKELKLEEGNIPLPREHYFYVHLIDFIYPLYPTVEISQIHSLSECSYKYFKFLLAFDDFIDSKDSEDNNRLQKFINLKDGFINYEQSICGLAYLFLPNSTFWNYFQECKETYFKAILIEKQISSFKSPIDELFFQQIAKGKSAICLNAVYALQVLANDSFYEKQLVEVINQVHIAFQLLDDIDDFKKDIHEGQWTYPQYLLQEYLTQNNITNIDTGLKHKYLYISGISETQLEKAIIHLKNAQEIANTLQLNDLSNYIQKQIGNCDFHSQEIKLLSEKSYIKSQKSQVFIRDNNLDSSIHKGMNYLEFNLNSDSTWSDFMTSAGMGKAWVTGFVGFNLSEVNKNSPALKKITNTILENPNKFLSYNESIFQDGDSLNFLVGFLHTMEKENRVIYENWLKFTNSDGGWVTYRSAVELRERLDLSDDDSVDGWLTSKLCVTAVACYILSLYENHQLLETTSEYLRKNLINNHWNSYWWTSSIYATAYAILAFSKQKKYRSICEKPCEWIVNQQTYGFWQNPLNNQPSVFYSALALKALIFYDKDKYINQIEKGIDWILSMQTEDGSWKTDRILRIPATNIENPEIVEKWRNSSFGVNCVTDDHNRVFTTSSVINCLATYKEYTNGH